MDKIDENTDPRKHISGLSSLNPNHDSNTHNHLSSNLNPTNPSKRPQISTSHTSHNPTATVSVSCPSNLDKIYEYPSEFSESPEYDQTQLHNTHTLEERLELAKINKNLENAENIDYSDQKFDSQDSGSYSTGNMSFTNTNYTFLADKKISRPTILSYLQMSQTKLESKDITKRDCEEMASIAGLVCSTMGACVLCYVFLCVLR